MRDLVMSYLNNDLSRRGFLRKMAAAGFTTVAAKELLESLSPLTAAAAERGADAADGYKTVQGTGGEVLVEQLGAAGTKFLFIGNSSHLRNVYDAVVERPWINIILAVEEGQAVAMASGFAMASGKLGVVACSLAGAPHCSSNMYNAMTAQLPIMIATDYLPVEYQVREEISEGKIMLSAVHNSAKSDWFVPGADFIPDITRRAIKVATTAPGGPVSVTFPEEVLAQQDVKATIIPQEKFNVPATIKGAPDAVEAAARMLLEAKNPCMYVGPEAWTSGARAVCIELAELLGIPAARVLINSWVDTFPTDHALFVNAEYTPNARFPRSVDLLLVIGGGFIPDPGTARLIHLTTQRNEINKVHPAEVPILADTRLGVRDIIDAIKSMATAERIAAIAKPRIEEIRAFDQSMRETLRVVAKANWDNKPISWARMALELDGALDADALIIEELSTEKTKVFSYLRTRDCAWAAPFSRLWVGEWACQSGRSSQILIGR
jgi:thiamine pyrophosphate-dependent acetolactate synthase large subunit-like protein